MSVVPIQKITRNQRFSIVTTLRAMEKVYMDDIVKPLKQEYRTFFDMRLYLTEIPNTLNKITKILEDHAKTLIDLEVVKNQRFSTLDEIEKAQLWGRLMSDSWYKSALTKLHKRLEEKIYGFIMNDNLDNIMATSMFKELLFEIGLSEFKSMRRILLTESQTILNNTLEAVYRKEENEFGIKYYYKWQTAKDKRLTEYCF